FHRPTPPRDLPSFPTRRSSDLFWSSPGPGTLIVNVPELLVRPPLPATEPLVHSNRPVLTVAPSPPTLPPASFTAPATLSTSVLTSEAHTSQPQSPRAPACRCLL